MAGIDKTYINGREYPIYRQWWIDNYDKMIKELGSPIYLFAFDVFYPTEDINPDFLSNNKQDLEETKYLYDFPIWNTSEKIDKWLVRNCKIESFRTRMVQCYSYRWSGFKGQKWIPKPQKKQEYHR